MGTKNNPGQFDCYEKADPDEPMFVLLARDPVAPELVELWVKRRASMDPNAISQYAEAQLCAEKMREWYAKNETDR